MVAVALACLAAVLGVLELAEPPPPWTALLPATAALLAPRQRVARLMLIACAAATVAVIHVDARLAGRLDAALDGGRLTLDGRVASLPEPAGRGLRFEFAPASPPAGVPSRIRVTWYGGLPAPRAAERWSLALRLRAPRGFANPGGFDYEAWLFERGIGALATSDAGTRIAAADPGLLALRGAIADAVAAHCGAQPDCGVVQGLAVGHAGAIDATRWRTYRATGTLHLVAISGLHVTLLAALAYLAVRATWARVPPLATRWPAPLAAGAVALGVATAYAALAGFGVPARRTLLMLAVACAVRGFRRAVGPAHILACALVAVIFTDPLAVRAPGFWLSFGGVAVLLAAGSDSGNLARRAWQAQAAISIGLLPMLAIAFGALPLSAPLANALAIPVFNLLAIPATLAGILLMPWLPGFSAAAFELAARALGFLQPVLAALAERVPEAGVPAPDSLAIVAAGLGVGLALAPRGLPGRAVAPLLFLPLLVPAPVVPERGGFELEVLDVGQGLAAVVTTHGHTLIYDAGPAFAESDAGEAAVVPALRFAGRRPELLIVSHADSDHAGGVASLRRTWPALAVLAGEDHARIGPALPCRSGMTWTWDGVEFALLQPRLAGARGNAASCVLSVRGHAGGALLTGDLPAAEESALVAAVPEALRHAVLVSPHHGSASSSTPEFVAAVAPAWVVHAAGHRNRWRFPRADVVARYAAQGARQVVTGDAGAVRVVVTSQGAISVSTRRAEDPRLWRLP